GASRVQNMAMELRMAIEPWPVLGEEVTRAGTARYVDSSIERVQLKVKDYFGDRYIFTCNGRKIPLKETNIRGEYIFGIRYRAWQPSSCLHPTIGVQVPLVFEVIDSWNSKAVGGFTYHVAHPGGRNYATYPINSYEAEGRRISRFELMGHFPGFYEPPIKAQEKKNKQGVVNFSTQFETHYSPIDEFPNEEYPHTLDLRRIIKTP
ncbi:MAG: transglutaminase family protein, partial [Pseudomonadota bacterium]